MYHTSTQLPDGRLSVVIDPGAWTNLIGSDLARKLVTRALKKGLAPKQTKIKLFNVAGGGNGTQTCKLGIHTPIAVEHAGDQVFQHTFEAPIVEGPGGQQLPGLLGLRSLERHRCILDCCKRQLHFVSDGDV